MLPDSGLERYCGLPVYVGLMLDPDSMVSETDETNNAIVSSLIPAGSVTGLTCVELVTDQKCKSWLL